jgi:hypothetical protein
MLTALRTGICFRLAIALAAFAAVCFVAPPAVVAFGHGEHAVHCLTRADAVNHAMGLNHNMGLKAGASSHDHGAAPGMPAAHHSGCCGLFCLSALTPPDAALPQLAWLGLAFAPSAETGFHSRSADNPDPPPISLASV